MIVADGGAAVGADGNGIERGRRALRSQSSSWRGLLRWVEAAAGPQRDVDGQLYARMSAQVTSSVSVWEAEPRVKSSAGPTVVGHRDLPSDNHQAGHGWLRQRVIGLPVAIPPVRFRTLIPYGRELCRSLGRVRADPPVLGFWLITRSRRSAGGPPGRRVVIAAVDCGASPLRRRDVGTGQVAVRGSDQAVKAIRVRLATIAIPSTQVRAGAASMTAVTAVASRTRMTGLAAAVNLVRR